MHGLPVGGGTLAMSQMPGRTGDYRADLYKLKLWGPALVISMTEQHELDREGAGLLGRDLEGAGIDWLHLPVPDFDVPEGLDWNSLCRTALGALSQGNRVLVHCFGGCGRSGMIALRLMIAAGEAPDVALSRLRQIRPCAVETVAQMDWAVRG